MYDVERSQVAKFFSQQVVFLTGTTSGIGMMILYKILMCGPPRIFVLLRAKNGRSPEERFRELCRADIFDSLPAEVFSRVVALEGDITKPLLQLAIRDLITLRSTATIAINCAGVSREIAPESSQILHNVFGLEQFLQVCEGMENLRAVLTLSTCFAHANRTFLEEKLYPIQQSHLLTQTLTRRAVHEPRSLDGRVDSLQETFQTAHNFSKQLGEHLLHSCQLPVVLVRTVHITGALKDPYPGWFKGIDPILEVAKTVSSGLTTGITCESRNLCLMSPIDLVANMILLCAYRRALIREKGCRVCHCSPESNAAPSWRDFIRILLETSRKGTAEPPSRTPWILVTPFHTVTFLLFFSFDIICALTKDVIGVIHQELPRNTMRALRVYSNLHRLAAETRSKIVPEAKNVNLLLENLSETDRELFGPSLNEIVWEDYCSGFLKGNR